MADINKLIDLDLLSVFKEQMTTYVDTADAKSIKFISYDAGTRVASFFKTEDGSGTAAFSVTLPDTSSFFVSTGVAVLYNEVSTYAKGAYVVKDGLLYVAKESGITGAWDASKWTQTSVTDVIKALNESLSAVAKSGKAADVTIEDATGKITATTVEGALTEIVGKVDTNATNIGTISDLDTTAKTLVGAVNEVLETAENKVASVAAADDSVVVDDTTKDVTVAVKISAKAGNNLSLETTSGEEGLYVNVPAADTYVVKETAAEAGYAKTYKLYKNYVDASNPGDVVGDSINIPKDFLVKSATVETCTEADKPVAGYKVGDKYMDFVVNTVDASETPQHIYINVTDLIDVYTAEKNATQVQVAISDQNVISATIVEKSVGTTEIADDAVTADKIADDVLSTITGAVQSVTAGATNGTVAVDGTDVAVTGLDTAAYKSEDYFLKSADFTFATEQEIKDLFK